MYLNFQIKNKNVSMRDSKHIFLALNWLGWEIEKMKLFKPLRRRHRRRNWYVFYIKTIKISMFIFNVLTKSSYLINTGVCGNFAFLPCKHGKNSKDVRPGQSLRMQYLSFVFPQKQ